MERHLIVPELDLPEVPVIVIAWLVQVGETVMEGDRVLELLAGEVSFELDAPISGMLVEQCVQVEERVSTGQILGLLRARA
jgi:pyruvate/2-oxoglutarate dehydrogenase complex dihydrolipoamide acyltransferase (E2) component